MAGPYPPSDPDGYATTMPSDEAPIGPQEWDDPTMKRPYRLQTGDLVGIRFFYKQDLDDEVRIRPDGRISLMPVDDVPAAGLTADELDAVLTKRFAHILQRPDLSVIVREFAAQRAFVGGEVKRPGVVELGSNVSALSAIMEVGGPLATAELDSVLLIRRGEDKTCYVRRLNVRQAMYNGTGDVLLHAYDIVYVPRTIVTDVGLFVQQYINNIVPRMFGFQFLYNLNPEVQVQSDDRANLLFNRTNTR